MSMIPSMFTVNFKVKRVKLKIEIVNGKIVSINFKKVKGRKPLSSTKLSDFKTIVNKYSDSIVKSWIDFFVFNKPIQSKKITKRIK